MSHGKSKQHSLAIIEKAANHNKFTIYFSIGTYNDIHSLILYIQLVFTTI